MEVAKAMSLTDVLALDKVVVETSTNVTVVRKSLGLMSWGGEDIAELAFFLKYIIQYISAYIYF